MVQNQNDNSSNDLFLSELSEELSVSKKRAKEIYNTFFQLLMNIVATQGEIRTPIGKLTSAYRKPRKITSISNGKQVTIEGHFMPRLSASKCFKEIVNNNTAA